MGKFGQDAIVTPLLFFEGLPGIFNDHRESGPRLNNIISNKGNYLALSVQSQVKLVKLLYIVDYI